MTTGGGAANAATTFARQELKTGALIRVGADAFGDAIVDHLRHERITPFAVRDTHVGTGYSTILLTPGGERTILVYRGASEGLAKNEVPFRKLSARWAYVAPGTTPFPVMREILASLKARGTKLAFNPSKSYLSLGDMKTKELFGMLDVVIMNREEASYLTGVAYKNERGLFKKLDQLTPGVAVMTDGPNVALVSDGKYLYKAGIFKEKKLVDRTGAGDAFGSGFVAGLLQKNDITYALRLAAANATSVVESVGAEEGILTKRAFGEKRWKYLDLDIEPLS